MPSKIKDRNISYYLKLQVMYVDIDAVKVQIFYYDIPYEMGHDFQRAMELIYFRYSDQEYQPKIAWYKNEGSLESPHMMLFTIIAKGLDNFKETGIEQVVDMIERYRGIYVKAEYEPFTYKFDRSKVYI